MPSRPDESDSTTLAAWLAATPQMREFLSAIPVDESRRRGVRDAELIGLVQAYARAIDRIVASELNITNRLLFELPADERAAWLERWRSDLPPLAEAAFGAAHAVRFGAGVDAVAQRDGNPNDRPRAVAFVDLRGSTAFMATHDGDAIRDLVDGMFLAAQRVIAGHDVLIAKHLGDGIMLVGTDPAEMLAACHTAIAAVAEETPLGAGAGIDYGPLTTRAGDFFGTPVNCASRLAEIATAGEIVLTEQAVVEPAPEGTWSEVPVRGLPHLLRALTVQAAG